LPGFEFELGLAFGFSPAFGYGYRAVAKTRVAYVAMIGRVNAGWFRE